MTKYKFQSLILVVVSLLIISCATSTGTGNNRGLEAENAIITYETKLGNKAFAAGSMGAWGATWEHPSKQHAIEEALRRCRERGGSTCQITNVNDIPYKYGQPYIKKVIVAKSTSVTQNTPISPEDLNVAVQSKGASLQQISTTQDSIDKASLGKRVALVIGNSGYPNGSLRNPKNDAILMERTLRTIGFDVVTETDGTYQGMRKAIVGFGKRLKRSGKSTIGLVFYAGHGIQANGKNYLIPIDAKIEDEADLELSAVDANWILAKMDVAQNDLNFLILDACRNNPFARDFRSASRGLKRMDAPRGTMIAYSTRPGDVAADGDGVNSPYSLALSQAMLERGISASDMFITARNQVMNVTNDQQVPWEEGALTSRFYFAGKI